MDIILCDFDKTSHPRLFIIVADLIPHTEVERAEGFHEQKRDDIFARRKFDFDQFFDGLESPTTHEFLENMHLVVSLYILLEVNVQILLDQGSIVVEKTRKSGVTARNDVHGIHDLIESVGHGGLRVN